MKKIIAISLLCIYCFNLFGYIILFGFLQYTAYCKAADKLDKGSYKTSDLIEVKVACSLPYPADWKEYQRADGQINVNGIAYDYVQKKLSRDTLYLLCIPNGERIKLASAQHNYSSLVNDVSNPASGKKSSSLPGTFQKIFSAAFNWANTEYSLAALPPSLTEMHNSPEMHLYGCFITVRQQPPRAIAWLFLFNRNIFSRFTRF